MDIDSENDRGICVIIDHRPKEYNTDKDVVWDLFRKVFGYEIIPITTPVTYYWDEGVTDVSELKKIKINESHKAIILFVFGEYDPKKIHPDVYLNNFRKDICKALEDKPKILIQHLWNKSYVPKLDTTLKDDKIVHISSILVDEKCDYTKHPALFIQSMDQIFRKFADKCDIIELFTKVCRDVEISQATKKKREKVGEPNQQVAHKVTFSIHVKDDDASLEFKMYPCESYKYSSSDSRSEDENPQALTEDEYPSKETNFYLNPGQYEGLKDTYSEFELEKLPSIKIEFKDQKLKDDIKKYPMDKNTRGYCIIINASNDRLGSILDELRMCQLFKELYFKPVIISNRSHEEIEEEIKRLAEKMKKEDIQCLFIILMGHGGLRPEDKRFTSGTKIDPTTDAPDPDRKAEPSSVYVFRDIYRRNRSPKYLFKPFEGKTCPLNTKPKICVLQTCFGTDEMQGCSIFIGEDTDDITKEKDDLPGKGKPKVAIPHEKSDWYKLHATVEGYRSYRTQTTGAYVIDSLDEKFRVHAARSDISQLMTMVTGAVSEKGNQEFGKWQQPECRTYFNGSLYLNPGFTKPEYQTLPVKDSPGDSLQVDIGKMLKGSVCWAAGKYVAVAKNVDADLRLIPIDDTTEEILFFQNISNEANIIGIISGIMLSEDKHIIIYVKCDGKREIVVAKLDKDDKTWKVAMDLTSTISNPLTLCEINNDCFGVLRGTPITNEDVTIEVYTCDAIKKFMEKSSEAKGDPDIASTPIQPEYVIRVNYARNNKISLRDKLCYSQTKFYILSFYKSIVYQVSVNGKIEDSREDFNTKPVALLKAPNGAIDIVCCGEVYTEIFGQKKVKRLNDSNPQWAANAHRAVASHVLSKIKLIPIKEGKKEELPLEQNDAPDSEVKGIYSGLMLADDTHMIIYMDRDGYKKIDGVAIDTKTKKWKIKESKLSDTVKNPLTMCEVNNDCIGILQGIPHTNGDATIEVYKRDELLIFINGGAKDPPVTAQPPILVKYAKHNKIDIRDQICISNDKFYILSVSGSAVYKVNMEGDIQESKSFDYKPIELQTTRESTMIDVACRSVLYKNVFGKKTKKISECYVSHMLKLARQVVVVKDSGLDYSTLVQVPQLLGNDIKLHKEIQSFGGIRQQCIWTTNKIGVVAVGSAESSHISLVGGTTDSPKQFFIDKIKHSAKIIQGIYLHETTHLVVFQTNLPGEKNMLKLVTIDVKAEKVEIIQNDPENTKSDNLLSMKNAAIIFAIDKHTFGVVCNVNGPAVEIRIYDRETKSLEKVVKLDQAYVGGENDSACVDANGEFYVSNYTKREVKHFDVNGLLIETLSAPYKDNDRQTVSLYRVMVDKDNSVFILCQHAIYRLEKTPESTTYEWKEVFKFDPFQSWDVCFENDTMYSVCEEQLNIYRLETPMDHSTCGGT